jgi:hypothetical protein
MPISTIKKPKVKIDKGANYAVLVYMDELSVKIVKMTPAIARRFHKHADELANGTYTDCYDDLDWLMEHGEAVINLEDAVAVAVI